MVVDNHFDRGVIFCLLNISVEFAHFLNTVKVIFLFGLVTYLMPKQLHNLDMKIFKVQCYMNID